MSHSTVEWTPIILSVCLVGTCLAFTVWALFYANWHRPKTHRQDEDTQDGDKHPNKATDAVDSEYLTEDTDMETASTPSSVVLEWSGVTCAYATKKRGRNESTSSSTTLTGAHGRLKTQELTAIMGPSGSGKSTLLDILSGRKTTGTITGTIRIFGQTVTDIKEASLLLRDVTAFVPQEVAFFPMQTPEEALLFVAQLKHGNKDGSSRLKDWCHRILKDVGLDDSNLYTRPIGGILAGGMNVRGLSGGEKKRLALACALAMKPRLLMLDEITSGLDSENALATLALVKHVCRKHNVATMVVIHQPNGYIFETFDRLVLLSKGHCIFSDNVSSLPSLYQRRFSCKMPESSHEVPLNLMRKLKEAATCKDALSSFASDHSIEVAAAPETYPAQLVKSRQVPFHFKLGVVMKRNLVNHYVRNVTNLAARLLCYSACSLLDGAIFWQVGNTQSEAVVGAFTFIILISYLLPFATIPIFVHEKKFFLSERSLGLYPAWIYCVSQTFLETWVLVQAAVVEALIVIPMCGLMNKSQTTLESFLTLLSALVASGLTGSALVLFFSILMPSQDLAFLLGSGVVTLSLGLSGGFVHFPSLEDFISWLQWSSPCKYSLQALTIGHFQGSDADLFVKTVGLDRPDTVTANIGVLFLFYIIWAVATMFALYRQRERR